MLTGGLWLTGRAVRSHRSLAANLKIRAFELESEREQFAAESVRYERDRIARELHDVIAHCVSIIVIQASAGQRLAPGAPAGAELLANITELAREAAADIGGLTSQLNPALEHPLTREHLDDLLARTAQADVTLDFDIVGDVVRLEIVNHPPPAGAVAIGQLGSGHGLTGLAERAAALGGTVQCGPVRAGGWRVSAEFPADESGPPPRSALSRAGGSRHSR